MTSFLLGVLFNLLFDSFNQNSLFNFPNNTFSKKGVAPFKRKIFPISFRVCFTTIQGFQKRYITFFQLNWPRNGGLQSIALYPFAFKLSCFFAILLFCYFACKVPCVLADCFLNLAFCHLAFSPLSIQQESLCMEYARQ